MVKIMYNYMKWPVGELDDIISSLKMDMFNFNIDIDVAIRLRNELEYKCNRDIYHKYAYCYLSYVVQKYDSSVDFYTVKNLLYELTNENFIPAYNLMGNAYYYGWGFPASYSKALECYEYAHNKGYLIATYNLALHNFKNNNYSYGRELIEQCINGGYASGYYAKGYGYQFGKYGYPVDKAKALSLYEMGASKSETKCCYFAGSMYMSGIACTPNYDKALQYLERAAMFGDVESKFLTGLMYFDEKYCNQFYEKALYNFEEAANLGHIKAMSYAGLCYLNGYGCYPDRAKAAKYIKDASYNNDELAKKLLQYL